MIALLQRVSRAQVRVVPQGRPASTTSAAGVPRVAGEIGAGLLALVCAERGDTEREADALLAKLLACRVFADAAGKMNLSVRDIDGGVLLVPQFTLAADTSTGTRPSFSGAAPPAEGHRLFTYVVARARGMHPHVAAGEFGAMMQVELVNDGPVTLWLQVQPQR